MTLALHLWHSVSESSWGLAPMKEFWTNLRQQSPFEAAASWPTMVGNAGEVL